MLGTIKKQKVDKKSILVAIDSALEGSDTVSADELLAETGKTRQELLNAVMADDEVLSCRADLQGAISAEMWRIWGEDVDEELINHLYRMIRRLMRDFNSLAVLAKFNGFAIGEYVFIQEPSGFLTLHQILSKDGELDNYLPQRDGSVQLKTDDDNIEINQTIKYLVIKSEAVPARPSGEMMIVRAYPAVAMRTRQWAYARQFIARYAQPYVIGKQGDTGTFGKSLADFTSKIFSFISGGAIGIGSADSVDIHQLTGNGEAFELLERLANRRIQKLLLGRVKTSELSAGSRSAQETDDEARQDRISSYLELMTQGIQHAIDATIAVNSVWGKPITAPKGIWFEYQKSTKPDLNRAQVDQIYAGTGQVVFTEAYYKDILGYEEKHFKVVEPSARDPQAMLSKQFEQLKLSQNLPTILTRAATDDDAERERKLMQPKVEALLSLLDDCGNYMEFERRLNDIQLPDGGIMYDLMTQSVSSYIDGVTADNRAQD